MRKGFIADQFYEYKIICEGYMVVGGSGGGPGIGGSDSGTAIHVHYPLTWAKSGYLREVGPSTQDNSPDQIWPGLVYDYTDKIYAGDPDRKSVV